MLDHGMMAFLDGVGNVVGGKGSGPNEIILLGHIDTFPGELPVYQDNNLLFGRGSVDAKGPLCTFAAAVSQVDVPNDWRLTVVGAVEEEAASSRGARHLLNRRRINPPKYCIIGEPSRWDRITLGYKGRLLLHVSMEVPYSHSAGQGILPAECGVNLWRAMLEYTNSVNRDRSSAFSKLDASLRAINTLDQGAYGRVNLAVGFRLPEDVAPSALEETLRELVGLYAEDWSYSMKFESGEKAYRGPKSTLLVRAFLKSIRNAGGNPKFVTKTGTSDMNVVAPVWRCPILAYGPGNSSLDHTPEEHIDLNEYLKSIDILTDVLARLMHS
jgi:LysW-gamma-L-lysine carboxypeptidase